MGKVGPVIWRLISHYYCGATTGVTLPWSSACMASGPGWSTSHMLANRSILSDIEEQGNRVVYYHCWFIFIFYFWWMLAFQLLRRRSAKHGTCWMSHMSAKGAGHEQRGRASPLLPLLGRRPHIVLVVCNDTKCDLERKTCLVGRSWAIHVNKYKT